MADSQNGYPVLDSLDDTKYYDINKENNVRIPLAPGDAGWLLAAFVKRIDKFVEQLDRTDTHGYNKRQIANSDDWSNHASGTAADVNATKHVQGRVDTWTDSQVVKIRKIQADFDNVIKWGGDYRATKDEMHFEIIGNEEEVSLATRVQKRYGKVSLSRLAPGKRNLDVYLVKRALRREGYDVGTYNFYFGVALTRALKKFQIDNQLNANGAADRKTTELLGLKPE